MLIVSKSFYELIKRIRGNKIADIIWYGLNSPNGNNFVTAEQFNYLTLVKGELKYLPVNKELELADDGKWSAKNRQGGKPAKVIRKGLTPLALKITTPKDFEDFANLCKTNGLGTSFTFERVNGEEIARTYDSDIYEGDEGPLTQSCMNGDSEYLNIYTKNESVVQMVRLIHNESGSLAGRALIWHTEEGVFMDRIYTTDDWMVELFKEWAFENDIDYMKTYQSMETGTDVTDVKTGKELCKIMNVKLNTDFYSFPYIDTFSWGGDGWLCNEPGDHVYVYNQTEGGRESENRVYCERYDDCLPEDEVVYVDSGQRRGENVSVDDYVMIDGCTYSDDDDDVMYSDYNGRYIYVGDGDYTYCEDIEDYSTDSVYCETDGYNYANYDELVEHNGYYYSRDDENVIEYEGDYYHIDEDCIVEVDGEYYHEEDEQIKEKEEL